VCVRGTFVVSVSLCTPRPGRYTLSLHDALPIWLHAVRGVRRRGPLLLGRRDRQGLGRAYRRQLRQRGRGARVRAWRRVFGARRRVSRRYGPGRGLAGPVHRRPGRCLANPEPDMSSDKLAVLIDADNAQASIAAELLAEVSRYGTATIKRAYGDWTTPNLRGWKEHLQSLAIQPIQQFANTTGKNATDSALIIDAMDLLHGGLVNGFCIVSSDSDFTRLATRIRESGLVVYGLGEQKTPAAFVAAC